MTENLIQAGNSNLVADQERLAGGQQIVSAPKKKTSWLHTILWMFSMMLLVNVAMAIAAYFLFFYKK